MDFVVLSDLLFDYNLIFWFLISCIVVIYWLVFVIEIVLVMIECFVEVIVRVSLKYVFVE